MKTKKAVVGSIFGMVVATIIIILVLLLFIFTSALVRSFYGISATTGFKNKDASGGQELGTFFNKLNNSVIFDFVLNCEADVNGQKVSGYGILFNWDGTDEKDKELNVFTSSCAEKVPYFEISNGTKVLWYYNGVLAGLNDFPDKLNTGRGLAVSSIYVSEYNIGKNKIKLSSADVWEIFNRVSLTSLY